MAGLDIDLLLERLREVVGAAPRVPLHEPLIGAREKQLVAACIESGSVSTEGEAVPRFEAALARSMDGHRAVALVNGTAALRLAMSLAGVRAGEEVILPALTFVGTANAAAQLGAVPHFVDVEEATLGLDPQALEDRLTAVGTLRGGALVNRESGQRIAAVVPVHCFGYPARLPQILAVAERWRLPVIENASEALGSRLDGQACGALAPLATLSFAGDTIVTAGGGGALVAADEAVAEAALHLATAAKLPHPWSFAHDAVASNDRLPALNAAFGLAQLEALPRLLEAKRRLHQRYAEALKAFDGVELFTPPEGVEANHWLNTLLMDAPDLPLRDRILERCHAEGLLLRPAWTLLDSLPMYRHSPKGPLPHSRALAARILSLPSSPILGIA